jgi:hypothetical protein
MTRGYRALTAALLRASTHAPVRAGIVPVAHALPDVFARLVNLLAR